MSYFTGYLLLGVGFYVGVSLCRQKSFKYADGISIARGFFFGIVTWPLAMIAVYILVRDEK